MRKIELTVDDETARELDELTENVGGDPAEVIRGLLAIRRSQAGAMSEEEIDAVEAKRKREWEGHLAENEKSFQDGSAVSLEDLARRNGL